MDNAVFIGKKAEDSALSWFELQIPGRVLIRNYRCRGGEIDFIYEQLLADGQVELIFVEVRSRKKGGMQAALESVTTKKQLRLIHAIRHFLKNYRGQASTLRCDILTHDGETWVHYPDIQLPC